LTPLDYFVWGHVKSLIYDTHVDVEFELLARILVARDTWNTYLKGCAKVSFVHVTQALKMEGANSNIYSSR
jgi:hypothetical protein